MANIKPSDCDLVRMDDFRNPPTASSDHAISSSPNNPETVIAELQRELAAEKEKRALAEQKLKDTQDEMDVTSNQIEKAIEQANQMALRAQITNIELNQIFNTSADGMWVIDKEFNVLRINQTLLKLLNRKAPDTIGEKCYDVFPGPTCHTRNCPMTRISREKKRMESDLELNLGDEGQTSFLVTATPFTGLDGQLIGIVEAYKDISDRKHAEEALKIANEELLRLATLDSLTRIANRRRIDAALLVEWKRMRREKKPLSLILCDVDYFKLYNDTYGHQLGDECLIVVAECLSMNLRRPGDLAARYGGEEFVGLLPDTDAAGAVKVAEAIRAELAGRRIPHGRSETASYVTLSLGVCSIYPVPDESPEIFVRAADSALYEAKGKGRNQVVLREL